MFAIDKRLPTRALPCLRKPVLNLKIICAKDSCCAYKKTTSCLQKHISLPQKVSPQLVLQKRRQQRRPGDQRRRWRPRDDRRRRERRLINNGGRIKVRGQARAEGLP